MLEAEAKNTNYCGKPYAKNNAPSIQEEALPAPPACAQYPPAHSNPKPGLGGGVLTLRFTSKNSGIASRWGLVGLLYGEVILGLLGH
jgi:hypothetical protein